MVEYVDRSHGKDYYANCYGLSGILVRSLLIYEYKTGDFIWDAKKPGIRDGFVVNKRLMIRGRERNKIGVAYLWMTDKLPGGPIDPADGDHTNLAWENIRFCPYGRVDPKW